MALPVLGAAAKFLASNGTRAAVAKYGKQAVDAAKKEIAKRDSAISSSAKQANKGVNTKAPTKVAQQMQQVKRAETGRLPRDTSRGQQPSTSFNVEKQGEAATKVSNLLKEKGMESPVTGKVPKFKKGGKVRGCGIAKKGVRACKMR